MSADYTSLLHRLTTRDASTASDWTLIEIHRGQQNAVYRAERDGETVAIKTYTDPARAEREYHVLAALRHFGINLGAEPLALARDHQPPALVMSWLEGQVFEFPPDLNDEDNWHRLMSAMGVSRDLNFTEYNQSIPLQGRGFMRPGDLIKDIQHDLAALGANHPLHDRLARVVEGMIAQVQPEWNTPAPIGLCRCDPAIHNFMLEGCCHILTLDWEHADWGDIAAEIGLWAAHPDYEDVPASQWVWVRWEFARLTNDPDLTARATVYTQMGQVVWAVRLAAALTNVDESSHKRAIKQRDRYLQRAEKIFCRDKSRS